MGIKGKRVAIVVTDGFEQSEYEIPKKALEKAGAIATTISLESGTVRGWKDKNWGSAVNVDLEIASAKAEDYDALLLPGGVHSPDKLRQDAKVLDFVRTIYAAGKPIAAICHGPWTLISAGVVEGKRMTSYPSIKVDLENAGAEWADASVVVDNGLVTSRNPNDLPDFCRKMIEEFGEGVHARDDEAHSSSSPHTH